MDWDTGIGIGMRYRYSLLIIIHWLILGINSIVCLKMKQSYDVRNKNIN